MARPTASEIAPRGHIAVVTAMALFLVGCAAPGDDLGAPEPNDQPDAAPTAPGETQEEARVRSGERPV